MHTVNKKVLFLAIALAAFTSFLIYLYMTKLEKPAEYVEYVSVVAAVKSIDKNAIIGASDVKAVKMVKDYVNQRAFTDLSDVVGKRAKEKIIEGEQILKDRVVGNEKTILSYSVPEGKRAVAINVNEALEVADFIRPGDYVDIIATFDKYEYEDSRTKVIYPRSTKTILQNILILGMGQSQDVPDKPRQELPKTVTVAVSLDEAEKLVFGEETGVLKMVLRRVGENSIAPTQGIIRDDLAPDKGKLMLPKQ